jgi:hypothetical protein
VTWSNWEPFSPEKSWVLDNVPGLRTVYFKARNSTIEALPVMDTITYTPTGGGMDEGTFAIIVISVFAGVSMISLLGWHRARRAYRA